MNAYRLILTAILILGFCPAPAPAQVSCSGPIRTTKKQCEGCPAGQVQERAYAKCVEHLDMSGNSCSSRSCEECRCSQQYGVPSGNSGNTFPSGLPDNPPVTPNDPPPRYDVLSVGSRNYEQDWTVPNRSNGMLEIEAGEARDVYIRCEALSDAPSPGKSDEKWIRLIIAGDFVIRPYDSELRPIDNSTRWTSDNVYARVGWQESGKIVIEHSNHRATARYLKCHIKVVVEADWMQSAPGRTSRP